MTFSLMLWMPSWGGMINGLLTLSGAWDKLRTDPVLRMLVVSVAFYGMSTFEGPVMSIKTVNSLSHYTDWTVGHVHSGALGWVAYVSFGALYCLIPWLWNKRELYSLRLVNWHFWISTLGIVLYITSMWVSRHPAGPDVARATPRKAISNIRSSRRSRRCIPSTSSAALGGVLFILGYLLMIYNVWMTIAAGEEAAAVVAAFAAARGIRSPNMSNGKLPRCRASSRSTTSSRRTRFFCCSAS